MKRILPSIATAFILSQPALAFSPDGSAAETRAPLSWEWSIEVKPMLWAPALRGEIGLPGGGKVDVEDLGVDEPGIAPAGRVAMQIGDWSVRFRGFGFATDENARAGADFTLGGDAVARGERIDTEVDITGFDLTAAYHLTDFVRDDSRNVRVGLDLCAGLRLHDVRAESRADGGASSKSDGTWLEPIVGLRLAIDLPHGFGLEVSGDIGGFSAGDDSSFSWDITAAFTWVYEGTIGLEIGFRHLDMSLETGSGRREFEFDAALAGLYGALVIRF